MNRGADKRRVSRPVPEAVRGALVLALAALSLASGCSDTELYSPTRAKAQANRIALEGRVCTEDPVQARFPVRVVLLVDRAGGPLFSDYDPTGKRVRALEKFVKDTLNIPKTALSVIGYAGRPAKLAPAEGNFTQNPGALNGAINQLSIPRSCAEQDQCRDYRDALGSARALIEGDIAELPAGTRVLTQYFVLMVNSGIHRPLADPAEDCPNRANTRHGCETVLGADIVSEMRTMVEESGAAGLQFHALHLAAYSGNANNGMKKDEKVQKAMEAMAFAGGGTYQRFNAAGGLDQQAFDVLGFRTVLRSKLLMAANHNALPGPNGPRVDSDADGLPDAREKSKTGTSPTERDTDGDAVTDRVELLVGLNPTEKNEPQACENIDAAADDDLDRLTNCDEALLGTEPTLVDTDGDALADSFEVFAGTDYLNRDADLDTDGDGVDNGDEIRRHLDPRSNDTEAHLSFGYRYEVDDQGIVTDLFASPPEQVGGVQFVELSDGTTPGLGTLKYAPDPKRLRWKDARDKNFGRAVEVKGGGEFDLPSGSYAPVQGEDGKRVTVEVRPGAMPPRPVTESVRITSRRRQCLDYTVRNIRMMTTLATPDARAGANDIVLYFAQAPAANFRQPGPFRRAQIPVRFRPPDRRRPDDAILEVQNREFVRPEITLPDSSGP